MELDGSHGLYDYRVVGQAHIVQVSKEATNMKVSIVLRCPKDL